MLCRHRQCFVVEDLEALAFGDESSEVHQRVGDAPALPPPAAAVETTSAPTSPAAIVISDSPPGFFLRAEDRERPAGAMEEGGRPEKRPKTEASPSPPASPSPIEEAPLSPSPDIWRLDIEGMLGRPLVITDSAGSNPLLIAVLGRACALPWDMERWGKMDNGTLLLSTMRLAISVNF